MATEQVQVSGVPVGAVAAEQSARVKRRNPTRDPDPPARGTVLDLYDLLRTARMNVMYYGDKLWWLQVWTLTLDITMALAASSGLVIAWRMAGFTAIPKAMGLFVAVATVIRPVLGLQQRVKRVSGLWTGYLNVWHSAEQIVRAVRADRAMTTKQRTLLANLHERFDSLEKEDDTSPSDAKLDLYRQRVIDEIPVTGWWLPADDTLTASETASAA